MTDTTRLAPSSRSLALEAGGEVRIHLTSNALRLRGVDGDRVVIRTTAGGELDDEIVVEASPGRVDIRDAERGFRLGPVRMRLSGAPDLDIDVPRSARVVLRTLSGDVEAAGIAGESRWASASGDLRLMVGGGPLSVESMSGDVTVEATAAIAIRARTVSGDLRIRAPRIDSLAASTTSGDVRVDADLGDVADHEISSVSGDVEVVTSSPVRIDTQTIAGDVRAPSGFHAEGGRGRRTLVAGAGSVRVGIRTTSGDIRLRSGAAGDPPTAPGVPVAPAAPLRPVAPVPPAAPTPPAPTATPAAPGPTGDPMAVVAEAEAAPNLVRAAGPAADDVPADGEPAAPDPGDSSPGLVPADPTASHGSESTTDRREAARLDVLRALERGELDVEAASHRLEQLEEAGPRYFRGWC